MAKNKTTDVVDAGQRAEIAQAEYSEKLKQLTQRRSKLSDDEAALLEEVFHEIVLAHQDQVWNLLRRRGLDGQDVEDLVQEVFLALFNYILEHGFPKSIPGLLEAFAKTKRFNHGRGVERTPFTIGLPSSRSEVPRSGPDIDRALDLRKLKQRILPQLSPEHRDVIEKVIMNELSHSDAAKALGLPEGTVKSRVVAAKLDLLARMEALVPPSQRGTR